MIRVISISTDRNIFNKDSVVTKRMIEYGKVFGELHIVVFSLAIQNFQPIQLSPNVFVYPTNSNGKFSYIRDAIRIGGKIAGNIYFGETAFSVQDPFETGIVGVVLKKRFKFPLQIQIHTDFYNKQFYDGTLLNWLRFEISRFTIPRANGIRVVRQKIADDLIHHMKVPKEKVTVLPIYVDIKKLRDYPITNNLRFKYPQWEKVILVASRLTSEKRVDLAIRVFARVLKRFPNVGMVIVGKGNQEGKLRLLSQKLNLEKNIVFEGWQQDVSSYYKTASVFLNCSSFEGYGLALMEAAVVGCPIVTTNVGIAQDILDDGRSALVCPIGDETCLANKLINMFGNPLIEKSLREQALLDMNLQIINEDEYLKKYLKPFEDLFHKS